MFTHYGHYGPCHYYVIAYALRIAPAAQEPAPAHEPPPPQLVPRSTPRLPQAPGALNRVKRPLVS